jgi:hypothetical protein
VAVRDADTQPLAAGQLPCVRAVLVEAQVFSMRIKFLLAMPAKVTHLEPLIKAWSSPDDLVFQEG